MANNIKTARDCGSNVTIKIWFPGIKCNELNWNIINADYLASIYHKNHYNRICRPHSGLDQQLNKTDIPDLFARCARSKFVFPNMRKEIWYSVGSQDPNLSVYRVVHSGERFELIVKANIDHSSRCSVALCAEGTKHNEHRHKSRTAKSLDLIGYINRSHSFIS